MADPIVTPGGPAIADPGQSRSSFELAASTPSQPNARVSEAAPASSPSHLSADETASYDTMLRDAEAIMSGKPVAEAAPPAEPAPVAKPAKSEAKLPPPIKREAVPPNQKEQHAADIEAASKMTEEELTRIPFEKWPRTAVEWKQAREQTNAQLNHYKEQVALMERQIKAGMEERDTFRNELRSLSIERDPGFKAEFDTAFGNIRMTMESILGKDDVDKASALFNQPSGLKRTEAVEKFVEDMSPFKQSAVMQALVRHDEISRMRELKISENTKNWDKLQLESRVSQEKQMAEQKASYKTALDQTVKEWTDPKNGFDFMRRTGDAAKDAHLDEMTQLADTILTGDNTPDEIARAALYAAMSPRLLQQLIERDSQLEALQKEIASLKGSNPSPSRSGDFSDNFAPDTNVGYGDGIISALREAGMQLR